MARKELLISWLNDAHGMERGIVKILENHIKDAKNYPQIRARLQEHLEATRRHADLMKHEITRLGGSTSSIKDIFSNISGIMPGISTGPAEDEMVKNVIADYAVEHFEIASYRALIAAGQQLGDEQLVRTCQSILRDEEEMARYLEQRLPMVVTDMMKIKASEHRAA